MGRPDIGMTVHSFVPEYPLMPKVGRSGRAHNADVRATTAV